MPLSSMPQPDAEARQHSETLQVQIKQRIEQAGGLVDFARYMEMALYTPGLGYYSGGSTKFGMAGDFTTAPELSPLFGACVARQCAQVIEQFEDRTILEFGAGTGRLALNVLQTLERLDCLPAKYFILELSAELRQRQQQTLAQAPHLLARVQWLDSLPQQFCGVILANEVVDAMPIHRLQWRQGRWYEEMVGIDGQGSLVIRQGDEADVQLLHELEPWQEKLPDGYSTEVNMAAPAWIQSLSQSMQQGVIFIIDYGFPAREYFHPQRDQGTLMCHYRHHAHGDPFFWPGLQDITAHVNFTSVAEAGEAAGLTLLGYTTQAWFLMANGLEQELQQIKDETAWIKASQAVKLLTMPHEMGELFKVMALGKGYEGELQGFAMQDMRGRL